MQCFSWKNNEKLGKVPKNTSITPVVITGEKNGKEKNPIDEILKSKKCVFFSIKKCISSYQEQSHQKVFPWQIVNETTENNIGKELYEIYWKQLVSYKKTISLNRFWWKFSHTPIWATTVTSEKTKKRWRGKFTSKCKEDMEMVTPRTSGVENSDHNSYQLDSGEIVMNPVLFVPSAEEK